jgi:membrane protein required for colicin V production
MNFLDILLVLAFGLLVARGFFRGFVREAIALASIFLAFAVASRYHDVLAPHLSVYISNEATIRGISYVAVFVGVLVACWLIARLLREMLEIALLGWLDRIAGAFFGMLEGAVVVMMTLLVLNSFFEDSDFLRESAVAPRAQPVIAYTMHLAPDSLKETLRQRGLVVPESSEQPEIMPDHPEGEGIIEGTVTNPQNN